MTDYELKKLARYQAEYLTEALKNDEELLDMVFPPRFMGIDEAAAFVGLPKSTLYQKISQIPHTKQGKRLIFTDRALSRWVKKKESVSVKMEIQPALRKVM